MVNVKIKKQLHERKTEILINGVDISNRVTNVSANISSQSIPVVSLNIIPDAIEIDGEFSCMKDKNLIDYSIQELMEALSNKFRRMIRNV